MAVFRTVIRSDLQKPLVVQQLSGNMFTADNASNEIAVEVTNGGEPVALSGAVTAYAVRSDGVTAMFSGTISGNVASVVLPASCYVEVGTLSIVIKVGATTVGACTCYVYRTTTDEIVDPGHVIPSIDELLEQIDACRTATANANTAATNANTAASNANTKAALADEKATLADQKATLANTAAQNADTKASLADTAATNANTKAGLANDAATLANTKAALADEKANLANTKATLADTAATNASTKAGLADTAAQNADAKATLANDAATLANTKAGLADTAATNANTAAGKIDNMTVAASGLPAGSAPIATISEVDGHKHIAFQIPKGDKGKDFHIAFTFASIAAMEAYSGNIELFDYAMIDTGNVQDADTGKLYCYEQDEEWHYIGDLSGAQGIKGETGTGIDHVALNNDYTLTIYYDDGTQTTTTSIRGATGITPNIAVGTVTTLLPDQQAYVTRDPSSTAENPVFNFGIPKGDTGSASNVYGTTVPMSESDSTSVYNAIGSKLNKNQGTANSGKFMKVGADGELTPENVPDPTNKADKVTNATAGNFAGLDATGNLIDSGESAEDFAGAIYKTATPGSIITIEDGADDLPVKELNVSIDPVQDLHGYDNPWPAGGGKNKYPIAIGEDTFVDNGSATHSNSNGALVIVTNASSEASGVYLKSGSEIGKVFNSLTPPFVVSFDIVASSSGTVRVIACGAGSVETVGTSKVRISRTVTSITTTNFNIYGVRNGATLTVTNLQIESGSTATDYAPYSNICPITGWTGAKVTRTGENLLPMPIESGSYANTMSVSVNQDKSFYVTKTSGSGWTAFDLCTNYYLPAGTYTFIHSDDGSQNCSCAIINAKTSESITNTRYIKTRTLTFNEGVYLNINYSRSATADNVLTKLMLFEGTTATADDYVHYSGTTISVVFPAEAGTVYGGTLDVTTGLLTVDKAEVDLGTLNWTVATDKVRRFGATFPSNAKYVNEHTALNAISSEYKSVPFSTLYKEDSPSGIFAAFSATRMAFRNDNFSDAATFKTSMSGVQLVYELATPVTYQLTPQEIRTLLGVNNIWADTGDITKLIYPVNTDTAMALYKKADKVANATAGNFAALDAEGNLKDSGKKPGDFLTEHQDISGKADKVSGATNGNFAGLDANGNLTDSGNKSTDFVAKAQGTQYAGWHLEINNSGNLVPAPYTPFMGTDGTLPGQKGLVPAPAVADKTKYLKGDGTWAAVPQQDISGKADKVDNATYGDLAKLDSQGNLVDSGIASGDVVVKADIASKTWEPETGDTLLSFINSNCNFAALPFSFAKTGSAVPADTPAEIAGSMFTGICIGHDGYITVKIQAFSTTATQYTFERDYYQGTWRTNWASIGATLQEDVNSTQDGVAIVAVGDTHDAISSGQFVFVRSHPTLAKGMYKATAAIAANGALSTSNLTADGSGGLNDLQSQITSLNSKIKSFEIRTISYQYSVNAGARVNTNFKTLVDADIPTGKTFLGIAGFYSGDAHTVINACIYSRDNNYSFGIVNTGSTDVTDRTAVIDYICM